MALNYLQRVAGAAVRTTAQAKPVATGPPRMPGIPVPPVPLFASSERHISETDSTWDTIDSVPAVPHAFDKAEPQETKAPPLAAPAPAREDRPAQSTASRFESLLRPPAEVIRTPPGLRSLVRPNPDRMVQPTPPPPLTPRLQSKPEAVPETSSDVRPAASPLPAVVTTVKPTQPTPAASAPVPSAPAVAPKPQPAAALPNTRAAKAESRIHIGRVEVQVNNTRPASPAPRTAAVVSPASDSLAARFLGRFILRP